MKKSEGILAYPRRASKIMQSINRSGWKYLFQEASVTTNILIASCIAVLYICYLFPAHFLAGKSGLFENTEPLASISGWWSFRADSWRLPLLHTRLLNAPEGANIAFTNSLPLMAFLLKPFQYFLPKDFHYFGLWFAISYLSQAISTTLAVRSLGQRTILASLAASMMGLMMPVLLWQTDNIPLATQSYLLLGLSLYFTGLNNPRSFKETNSYFALLLSLALLTHPYLCIMTAAFYLAFLGDYWIQSSRNNRDYLIALATTSVVIVAILAIGGYFSQTLHATGYGHYSMNLLSPFSGGKLGQPLINATGGQHRGFNYLGMGVLIALLLTAVMHRRELPDTIRRYRFLIGILVALTIFAISNQVFYGKHTLIKYPIFFPFTVIAETFRSSGRLFWPCGYTLMIIALIGVLRLEDRLSSLLSMVLVLGLQFYDTTPLRNTLYRTVRKPVTISANWHRLMRSVSSVQVYPAYGCGNTQAETIAFWQSLATRYGKSINTAYINRKKVNCPHKHVAFNKPLSKGQLYVVSKEQRSLPHHIAFAMNQGWCRKTDKGVVCVKNTDYNWWKNRLSDTTSKLNKPNKPKKKKSYSDWPDSVD